MSVLRHPNTTSPARSTAWTYLSNHGHVLLFLAGRPDARLRDAAHAVGITERAVRTIIGDLEDAGALTRTRVGRRNRYRIHRRAGLRHPVEQHCTVADILTLLPGEPHRSRAWQPTNHTPLPTHSQTT